MTLIDGLFDLWRCTNRIFFIQLKLNEFSEIVTVFGCKKYCSTHSQYLEYQSCVVRLRIMKKQTDGEIDRFDNEMFSVFNFFVCYCRVFLFKRHNLMNEFSVAFFNRIRVYGVKLKFSLKKQHNQKHCILHVCCFLLSCIFFMYAIVMYHCFQLRCLLKKI